MASGAAKSILLVEGESPDARARKRALEDRGYRVVFVHDAEGAAHAVEEPPGIDLVLADGELDPGRDGARAAGRLLGRREVPLILFASRDIAELAAELGACGCIPERGAGPAFIAPIDMALRLDEARRRERAEKELLRESGMLLAESQRVAGLGHWSFELATGAACWSDEMLSLFGLEREAGSPSTGDFLARVLPEDRPRVLAARKGAMERGERFELDYRILLGDGRERRIRDRGYAMRGADGRVAGLFGTAKDITELAREEAAHATGEPYWRSFVEGIPDFVAIHDREGRFLYLNRCGRLASRDVIGRPAAAFVTPEHRQAWLRALAECLELGEARAIRFSAGPEARGERRFEGWLLPIADPIGEPRAIALMKDVTERARAEEAARRQLSEKELLLKEAHHRIKNNLCLTESMLCLQARSAGSEEAGDAILGAAGRIRGIQLVYDKLLEIEEYAELPIKPYLEELVGLIVDSCAERDRLGVSTAIGDFVLDSKRAFAVGIIVNELITNACKYAFEGRRRGSLAVELSRAGGELALRVSDDGVGLSSSDPAESREGFGLTVVRLLCEQFGGRLSLESANGLTARVSFPSDA